MGGLFGGGSSFKMPTATAEQAKATAKPVKREALSEREKKSRRLAASLMTREWGEPTISKAGLMGI